MTVQFIQSIFNFCSENQIPCRCEVIPRQELSFLLTTTIVPTALTDLILERPLFSFELIPIGDSASLFISTNKDIPNFCLPALARELVSFQPHLTSNMLVFEH